jgi:cullin-associated NEDD8-dissociated protein 1
LRAGNPKLEQDLFHTQCWNDSNAITVRIADSCPCQYFIKETGETRTQNWCCGGNNHFDLSVFAFEQLAHPSYGVMPIEYRPVDCETGEPLR